MHPPLDGEAADARRQVYLVTFPHPRPGSPLTAPSTLSREGIMGKLLEACAAPVSAFPNIQAQPISLDNAAVFREYHKPDAAGEAHGHYHIAVKGTSAFRFASVKRALQEKFGLASHWSCTHHGYWSPVRYCTIPSPAKPRAALDPPANVVVTSGRTSPTALGLP